MKNKSLFTLFSVLIIVLILVNSGLLKQNNNEKTAKVRVMSSIYPMYFFASQIGGDKAKVKNITPAGVEPHEYDPSPRDIANIEDSDMLVLNGVIETWANKTKDNLKEKNVKIVTAGEGLFTKEIKEEGQKIRDPHIWLNPRLAKKQVDVITRSYISIDILNKNYYLANQKKLNNDLDRLDREYKKGLQNCQNSDFITSHAAFSYLAEAYNLNQVQISGLSPDQEPSARKLAEIAKFAVKHDIKYIFFESLVNPKLSETIAHEVGAKTIVLDPIEGISEDGIRQGKNYFTLMKDNLKNLCIALRCEYK